MNPRYPVFVPTKGRYETRFTIRTFDEIGVPYRIVVEPQEADLYARYVDRDRIVVTPHRDEGLTVTRNFIWDLAESEGHRRFWTFDDNIKGLFRFNRNLKTPAADGTIIRVIEDWTDRYQNVAIAGMNYFMFASRKVGNQPPLYLNTRVYSNMLIETALREPDTGEPIRNELFYNDDTDLCLRVLKAGFVTALFNAFLIGKETTMAHKGGMTDYYEETNDRLEFVEELKAAHPEVVTITKKWGRWHHHVDYSPFARNKPIFRPDVEVPDGTDDYGMVLEQEVGGGRWVRRETDSLA